MATGHAAVAHVHRFDEMEHGERRGQHPRLHPHRILHRAGLAETLRADIAAAVALDALEELLLPERPPLLQRHSLVLSNNRIRRRALHRRTDHYGLGPGSRIGRRVGTVALLGLFGGAGHSQEVQSVGIHLRPLGHLHQCAGIASPGHDAKASLWIPLLQQRNDGGQRVAGSQLQLGEIIPLPEKVGSGSLCCPPQSYYASRFAVQFLKLLGHVGANLFDHSPTSCESGPKARTVSTNSFVTRVNFGASADDTQSSRSRSGLMPT